MSANQSTDFCQCNGIHQDTIENVRENLLNQEHAHALANFFKVFSDPTRIKILSALFQSELCVCDLANVLGMTHSAVSHQLRLFKTLNLVKSRREGTVVYYSLVDDHISTIFYQGLEHIKEKYQ